jgi:CrcB protein
LDPRGQFTLAAPYRVGVAMMQILLVAMGGAAGSVTRYLATLAAAQALGTQFPWGTLLVNIVGSFLMGLVIALGAHKLQLSNELRLALTTGFLGGFTTFSAFSLDFATLFERKDYALAALYLAGSVGLSILALFAALILVRQWQT